MKSLTQTLTRGATLAGAVLLSHATAAAADSGESTVLHLGSPSVAHSASGGSSSIVRTVVGLFIVIAVIYGIAWILRQAKGGAKRARGRGLDQLANLPLGSGKSVALVRAGREVWLVGVAEQAVTPIRTYTEAEALSLGLDLPPEDPPGFARAEGPLDRVLEMLRRITVRS
jgi:flagellar protein FliO/FliZ